MVDKAKETEREIAILQAVAENSAIDISNSARAGRLMRQGLLRWQSSGDFGWYITEAGRATLDFKPTGART